MEFALGLAIAATVGWIVWSMLSPPVLYRITIRDGRVRVSGRRLPTDTADIEEFFQSNFPAGRRLRVTVAAPSSQPRSRIIVSGQVSDGEKQLIRNFLLNRV